MQVNKRITHIIAFVCTVLVAAALFVYWGNGKRVTFCDEVYTYTIVNSNSLASYNVNSWMSGDDFVRALTHDGSDYYEQMLTNIKSDKVHPPLYYVLVYISAKLAGTRLTVWTGLIVNLAAFLGTAVILFLIFKKLFEKPVAQALGTIGILWTQCMISDAMLIRMYMLYTFFTALFAYANLRLMTEKDEGTRARKASVQVFDYALLALSVVGGFMTQYYFVFFVMGFGLFAMIYNIVNKKYLKILKYAVSMVVAAFIFNMLWGCWFEAITSNTHSASVIGNAKGVLSHLGSIFSAYKLVIMYVFEKAYKVFMVLIPLLIASFYILTKKENRVLRAYAGGVYGVAFMYAVIINILTPDYLSSTRYYYAAMMLILLATVICVFAIAECFAVREGRRSVLVSAGVGAAVVALNAVLTVTGFGIDYYPDTEEYDDTTKLLESYSGIPWIIGGDMNWLIDSAMFDYTIPERIMPLNINGEVADGAFDGVDEFILAQSDDSEFITQKNLYNFIMATGKNVEVEKLASRGYVNYFYCRTTDGDSAGQQAVDDFIDKNKDTIWLVVNDDGWYDAEKLFPDGEPENVLFIDSDTAYDTEGKYKGCTHAAIITSLYGDDVVDVAVYYMIGSTGSFYGSEYVGTADNGTVAVYSCDLITE